MRGLWNAAAGMRAQQQKIDVTANNIANVNTTGFKKKDAVFQDLVYQSLERKGNAVAPAGGSKPVTAGTGSALAAVRADFRPGTYLHTGAAYDMAIVGDGFFRVVLPDGTTAYTRDGSFHRDGERHLVTAKGMRVAFPDLPEGDYDLNISPEGVVRAVFANGESRQLGTLELARFPNPNGLQQAGDNLLLATAAAGEPSLQPPDERTKVLQGYLEGSNVDLAEEMIRLMVSQRAFELNSRALRTADEMWGIANQIRR